MTYFTERVVDAWSKFPANVLSWQQSVSDETLDCSGELGESRRSQCTSHCLRRQWDRRRVEAWNGPQRFCGGLDIHKDNGSIEGQYNSQNFTNIKPLILFLDKSSTKKTYDMFNHSRPPLEFLLSNICDVPALQIPLFVLFLNIYLLTMLGNWVVILIIYMCPTFHTPMYFFIGNLGILDAIYISTTVPKMLTNYFKERKSISYVGCVTQLYVYLVMAATESTLLSTMAYDRYVAICHPLEYHVIMNKKFCLQLATTSWTIGIFYSLIHTGVTFRLNFCKSIQIDHFFCDIPPLLKISCSSTFLNEIVVYVVGGLLVLICFPLIIISYIFIVKTVINISTAKGRIKTCSTCISHFVSVSLFYVSGSFAYFHPISPSSFSQYKVNALFYTILPPLLNPLIYSLRNKELNKAFKKILKKI
ncbi:olfactory receptor 8A1-like [Dendropsophus ebraccatus]|uniref:olfactory receptor 8A1-like n=1 Tax=Dendropsophus ebraccatus TaxID=150705 RepID=UPI00383162CB